MKKYIGLDCGRTKIAGALFSHDGALLAQNVLPTPKSYEAFLDTCRQLVAGFDQEAGAPCPVGVGFPGAIDHEMGSTTDVNLAFMVGKPFRNDLSKLLNRNVSIANDSKCIALAEAMDGAGYGYSSVLGLNIGTGIGSGLIINGQLLDGPNGLAGEVGHLPLPFREEADGPLTACGCGQKDCAEKAIAGPAFARLYSFMTGKQAQGPEIAALAKAGDADALRVLDRYYDILAKAMLTPIYAFDPEIIVISGGMNNLPGMYEELPKRLQKYSLVKNLKTKFAPAVHGPMAGLRGAAWLGR